MTRTGAWTPVAPQKHLQSSHAEESCTAGEKARNLEQEDAVEGDLSVKVTQFLQGQTFQVLCRS